MWLGPMTYGEAVHASQAPLMLDADDLAPADEAILSLLREGRITAPYAAERTDYSLQYIRDRLGRMVEHGNALKVTEGLYELDVDPMGDVDDAEDAFDLYTSMSADDDILETLESDEFDFSDISKTNDRVRAIAILLTRIRNGARYTSNEIAQSHEQFGIDIGDASWRKAVNEAADVIDDINRTQTAVYWSPLDR